MESLLPSAVTGPSFDDCFAHNMWNFLLELLLQEHAGCIFESFLVEFDLTKSHPVVILLLIHTATKKCAYVSA